MATRGERWAFWLEAALDERGWSRAEIAKRSRLKPNGRPIIDAARVSEWLNKSEAPSSPEILRELADILDVRMAVVLNAAGWLPDDELVALDTSVDGAVQRGSDSAEPGALTPAVFATVAEAIRQDADLLEETKQHLLDQYDMLRRLSLLEPAKPAPGDLPPPGPDGGESIEQRRERLRVEHTARARRMGSNAASDHGGVEEEPRRAAGDDGRSGGVGGGAGRVRP